LRSRRANLLVHAGAGGVGQLLVQLAKARGAHVFATVGSAEKAAIVKALGADAAILYRAVDFREAVLALTGGEGVDVVYDSVGRDTIHKSIRSLRRRGTCVMFGASSGQVEGIAPLELAEAGSVFFTRPHLADSCSPRCAPAAVFRAAGAAGQVDDRAPPLADLALAHCGPRGAAAASPSRSEAGSGPPRRRGSRAIPSSAPGEAAARR
jgi:NADPH2:quinone reductase